MNPKDLLSNYDDNSPRLVHRDGETVEVPRTPNDTWRPDSYTRCRCAAEQIVVRFRELDSDGSIVVYRCSACGHLWNDWREG